MISERWKNIAAVAWLPVSLATLWLAAPFLDGGPVFCSFRRGFGLPCPGCGMTRAVAHLLRGDMTASLAYHPLVIPTVASAVIGWVYVIVGRFNSWRLPRRWVVTALSGGIGIFVVVWAARLWRWFSEGALPDMFR